MTGLSVVVLSGAPVYKVRSPDADIRTAIAASARAAQGVARAIRALPTEHRKNAAEAVVAALMPMIKRVATETKKGYPEFNPDEARTQSGEWTSGGASAPREITLEGKRKIGPQRRQIAAAIREHLIKQGVPADSRDAVMRSVDVANARIGLPSRDTVETMQKVWFALFLSAIVIAVASVAIPMAVDSLGRAIGGALKVLVP
jgi:hypothetical protein